jgi:hypothetical protein
MSEIAAAFTSAFQIELRGSSRKHGNEITRWLLDEGVHNYRVEPGKVKVISFEMHDGDHETQWIAERNARGLDGGRKIVNSIEPIPDSTPWQDATGRTWTSHGNLTLAERVSDEWIPEPRPGRS